MASSNVPWRAKGCILIKSLLLALDWVIDFSDACPVPGQEERGKKGNMILVTGDIVLDHNVYEGGRLDPDAPAGDGAYYRPIPGGAMLVHGLLHALDPNCVRFGLVQTKAKQLNGWKGQYHAKALWHAVDNLKKESGRHWALERYLGYGEPGGGGFPGKPAPDLNEALPRILVLDDGGLGIRDANACWPACLKGDRPAGLEWIVLKMSRPLAGGKLWNSLMRDSWRERLIVIVSADQLRSEGLRVAGGFSWETSVDDIVEELESNMSLRSLERCRHLIVTMRSDAALWLDQAVSEEGSQCKLVFDRKLCEGEWEEKYKACKAYGFQSAMTASVTWALLEAIKEKEGPQGKDKPPVDEADLTAGLAAGISTKRYLLERGHGPAQDPPAFPFKMAADHLRDALKKASVGAKFAFTSAEVRCRDGRCHPGGPTLNSGDWTILGLVSPWHIDHDDKVSLEPARRVALFGPDSLPGVPCATFEGLQTLDRHEIDSLRSIRRLMLMYRDGGVRKQPLCLGVFGAPGAGKSFGLKQIAAGVFGPKVPILEFNLSQFKDPSDLIGAFHQVRDKVLSGETPVAFWDEFDAKKYDWLQYFLAPMQDGAFQEGQVTHFLGKSVFIFAGGTSSSFEEFNEHRDDKDLAVKEDFILKKGPDFISRLSGYLDIAGPNKRDVTAGSLPDREYPVRRAMLIRSTLELGDKPLQIERGLLTALLAVGRYRNGARSLNKLVSYIRDRGGLPLRRAFLPPDEILALYMEDFKQFHSLTRKYAEFYAQSDYLAPILHADYLKSLEKLSPQKRAKKPNDMPWEDLPPDVQYSNYAAALRIPEILELAGLALAEKGDPLPEVSKIPEDKLEMMAEAEHGGWEEQRRIDGWSYSRYRNDLAMRHNCLVSFDRLSADDKAFDLNTIQKYPKYADEAGYKIVSAPIVPTS